MPLVEVTIAQGRTAEQIRQLMSSLHDAVLNTVDARSEHIRVIVREVPRTHWATGDRTIDELRPDVRRIGERVGTSASPSTEHPAEEAP